MPKQAKPAHPNPNKAAAEEEEEIKVRKARLEQLRLRQMDISNKESALKQQLAFTIAEDDAMKKTLSAVQHQLAHACSFGLWEQYQVTQQEQESRQLVLDHNNAVQRDLEMEIKHVHEEWVAIEKETIAIWGRLGQIIPFGSIKVGSETIAKASGNIW